MTGSEGPSKVGGHFQGLQRVELWYTWHEADQAPLPTKGEVRGLGMGSSLVKGPLQGFPGLPLLPLGLAADSLGRQGRGCQAPPCCLPACLSLYGLLLAAASSLHELNGQAPVSPHNPLCFPLVHVP